jgi:hypothetical protein
VKGWLTARKRVTDEIKAKQFRERTDRLSVLRFSEKFGFSEKQGPIGSFQDQEPSNFNFD